MRIVDEDSFAADRDWRGSPQEPRNGVIYEALTPRTWGPAHQTRTLAEIAALRFCQPSARAFASVVSPKLPRGARIACDIRAAHMKNVEAWAPSKVVFCERRRRYVPNPRYVALGSRLAVAAMVGPYQRVVEANAHGRLLDCGCGDVPYYGWYRGLADEVVCIDWGQSLHGRGHLDHEVDLNQALPFEEDRFDTVILADVLEHIAEPARLMHELGRVLAPGGKLILMVPFLYRVHEAPHDYHRYTRFSLERMALAAGLKPIEISAYGGYPDVLLDLLNKGIAQVPLLCRIFLLLVEWATRTGLYDRWRRSSADKFPLGYCLVAERAERATSL
jgi:SAM-dependent methyltransferase